MLKSAQTQAMRLLEKAVEKKPVAPPSDTPPQVAPPPIKPPATPLPRPGGALVDEGIADGLDLSKAKDKFAALKGRQREDPPHSCADQLARRGEEGLMAAVALGMRSTVRNQP